MNTIKAYCGNLFGFMGIAGLVLMPHPDTPLELDVLLVAIWLGWCVKLWRARQGDDRAEQLAMHQAAGVVVAWHRIKRDWL